ncbi:MAG TPA: dephospho-CoA kinase [Firmicutes bacterium]|nr:dephospho-CoA kinase [Candidatus Fermentithermobacillaceae bacterium]
MSSLETRVPGVYAIGLTGGISTGKSTVSSMLASLGAEIIDADKISHQVTEKGSSGLLRVKEVFGQKVLNPDGSLNRRKLGRVIFNDPSARRKLEDIIHPLVMAEMRCALQRLSQEAMKEGRTVIAVLEVPLLFEVGAEDLVDEVWVVSTDPETQVRRLMAREGYSREEAVSRINAQMPLSEKVKRAKETIDNQGDLEKTRAQVEALWESVKRRISG